MNLYELIAANTAALEANTKAILSAGGKAAASTGDTSASTDKAAASTGKATTGKATTKAKGPTREQMVAALNEVKDKFGASVAKELIAENSSVTKMADIPEGEFVAVFNACKEKMEGGEAAPEDGDGL